MSPSATGPSSTPKRATKGKKRASAGEGSRPTGRVQVREALLDAARRLIAERGPSNVTLREIAAEADVNFGLVYQYVGTREDVLREVYRSVATRAALRIQPIQALQDAVADIMNVPDASVGRIMAWVVLEGDYRSDVLGPSPALEHIAELIAKRRTGVEATKLTEQDRLMAAFLLVTALGWTHFQSIGLAAAGLDIKPNRKRDQQVTTWLQELGNLISKQ